MEVGRTFLMASFRKWSYLCDGLLRKKAKTCLTDCYILEEKILVSWGGPGDTTSLMVYAFLMTSPK